MNARPRVVVTRSLPAPCEEEVSRRFDAVLNAEDVPLTPEQLVAALREADGLLPTVTDRLTGDVIGSDRFVICSNPSTSGILYISFPLTATSPRPRREPGAAHSPSSARLALSSPDTFGVFSPVICRISALRRTRLIA